MASLFAGLIAAGAGVAAGTTAFALINLGVGLALTALSQALLKQKKQKTTQPGLQQKFTGRGDTSPQSIILGRSNTAGHHIAPYYCHTRLGSPFGNVTYGDYATFIINLSDAPVTGLVTVYVDGVQFDVDTHLIATHPDYGMTVPLGVDRDEWLGKLWIKFYDGTQTQADPYLVAAYGGHPERPWAADAVHQGGAYAIITCRRDSKLYRGEPQFNFVVDGMPVEDPRVGTDGLSVNAQVLAWNILKGIVMPDGRVWGVRAKSEDLPSDWWDVAQDACDQMVVNASGSNEPQYRAGLEVALATPDDGGLDPLTAVDEFLAASSSGIADIGGTWITRTGAPGLPVLSITDGDILNSRERSFAAFESLTETHNSVVATFPDPDAKWEPAEGPLWEDAAAQARDGRPLLAQISLGAVPYRDQVDRLTIAWGKDAQRRRSHVLVLPPRLDRVTVFDTIAITSAIHGYTNKLFEVQQYTPDLVTGEVQIVVREVDPADWPVAQVEYTPGAPINVTRRPAPALQLISFDALPHSVTDGVTPRRPALRLVWTVPSSDLDGVAWQVYRDSELVVEASTVNAEAGEAYVTEGILPNVTYRVRGKPIALSQATEWSDYSTVTAPNVGLTPDEFADGVEPVSVVDILPSPSGYTGPRTVLLTTDAKLYRYDGSQWTSAVPTVDLTGQLTGTQIGNDTIDVSKLAAGAVTNTKIATDAVTTSKIAPGSITTPELAANSVVSSKIVSGAITANELAVNAVVSSKIAAGVVIADKIAANAVTADKISANAVTASKISANAITAGKIAAGIVAADKINTNSFKTAGLAVFGGDLESANFVAGVSGFRLRQTGEIEGTRVIDNSAVKEVAVEGYQTPEAQFLDQIVFTRSLGSSTLARIWHLSIIFEIRSAGTDTSTGGSVTDLATEMRLQRRFLKNGVWSGWVTFYRSDLERGGWRRYATVGAVVEQADDIQLRYNCQTDNPSGTPSFQTNVRNTVLIAQRYV